MKRITTDSAVIRIAHRVAQPDARDGRSPIRRTLAARLFDAAEAEDYCYTCRAYDISGNHRRNGHRVDAVVRS